MDSKLFYPKKNLLNEETQTLVPHSKNLVERGIDPKPILIEFCEPHCIFMKEKLERCEKKLEQILKVNPSKSCLYPMRDWVTCIEACVQPKIFHSLQRGSTHQDEIH